MSFNTHSGKNSIPARIAKTLFLPVFLYAILCVVFPKNYFSLKAVVMVVTQCFPYLAIGWSMMFGMAVGLFDFSVGARIVLAGLVGVYLSQHLGFAGFVLGCIGASLVLAFLTGAVYSFLKIPSIITGFAALLVFEAISVMFVKKMLNTINSSFLLLAKSPYIYIVMALLFVAIYITYNRTKFGYQIVAIGGNEDVARSMGIMAPKLKLMTYIVGGLFLGIATIISISNSGNISPQQNMGSMVMVFTPMMGVMIGMALSSCNLVIGTFIGELSITIISSALVAFNIEYRLQNVIIGAVLLIVMIVQSNRSAVANALMRLKKPKSAEA